MSGTSGRRGLVALVAMLAVALTGCGSSPAATASPTPTATPSPTPTATANPTSSAAADPAAQLKIAAPYSLVALDAITQAEFEAGIKTGLGQLGSMISVGARAVSKSGTPVAGSVVMVMDIPLAGVTDLPTFLDSAVSGMAGTMSGTVSKTTILGRAVDLVTAKNGVVAAYQVQTSVVFAVAPDATEAQAIATALIQANP